MNYVSEDLKATLAFSQGRLITEPCPVRQEMKDKQVLPRTHVKTVPWYQGLRSSLDLSLASSCELESA